jgi:uncharacterized membrane protein YebE (DUF533 family)
MWGMGLMQTDQPGAKEPTPDDLKDLETLKAVIDRAAADGKISKAEMDAIKATAWADGKITPEELQMYSELVLEKIRTGELTWEM